ncbi:hypothetical protein [Limosilactobacillus equigenerosi]|uniref:Uncharacterized protein n=1 Tax=Limosilactobacillus equigenerosi DSM 18793 = JCM 14505 TaxID=1423742 RepID=A0A0R1UFN7_9LACO|nr:hypothetical protein [Limosilactobacillus equigenerosi]KRL92183.1 hypothetical protein FC21_GL000418 [Limosilactobacillus equigenerosi DSM 18793 = JCM 14505]
MIIYISPILIMWIMLVLIYKNDKLIPLFTVLNILYALWSVMVGTFMKYDYNLDQVVSKGNVDLFECLIDVGYMLCLAIPQVVVVILKMKQKYKKDRRKFKTVKDEFLWTLTTRATGYVLFILLGFLAMEILFPLMVFVRNIKLVFIKEIIAILYVVIVMFGIPALYIIKLDAITNHLDQWLWKKYGNHSETLGNNK